MLSAAWRAIQRFSPVIAVVAALVTYILSLSPHLPAVSQSPAVHLLDSEPPRVYGLW